MGLIQLRLPKTAICFFVQRVEIAHPVFGYTNMRRSGATVNRKMRNQALESFFAGRIRHVC